jgi:hypothetical protein
MFYFLQHLILLGAFVKGCRTPFHKHRHANLVRIFTGQKPQWLQGRKPRELKVDVIRRFELWGFVIMLIFAASPQY